ncbi:acetyltransferase [Hoeflea sp. EC-HK425]|uniref:acetyltransferase n=1 Tax=Hoeflea sp. EC-HK425 TaxID=2038388 RepID=UPI001253B121|nr:acetyltransferase [Hoeflea sp. EC-HK425]VVT29596.1 Transferase [Hoeflea sp. EC-HK425]
MKKLVVFGTSDAAELAHYYFSTDTDYQVVAFTVDAEFMPEGGVFCGLPVVQFDRVVQDFPPDSHLIFVALGYSKLNQMRREKYLAAKEMGYSFASYISTKAAILNDGRIGENCFILENNTVQPFVSIGNNVTLWSGNHIGHHSRIEDHAFLASHIVVSGRVTIGEACFIGVNSTLRDHVTVGANCILGAGVLLLSDAAPSGVYVGNETERSRVPSNRMRSI